ncbi:MAG: hypothetical protein CMO01_26470 [Thalassobius sp.]|nr:hypothetical protein [Thalassovita sp.]
MLLRITTLLLLVISYFTSYAQPENYYDGTEGLTGAALKEKLHTIISGHKVFTYSQVKEVLKTVDEDPENSDNIILFYKNTSIPKENFASNNEPDYWNREHTWPKSHGFAEDTDTAYTDIHNLTPSDATVNTSKSNKDFNDLPNTAEYAEGEAEDTYTDSDFWDPRDDKKGDVARILFYMATRYEGTRDLELVDRISHSGDPEIGVLYTMIKWHEQDPVSDEEIARNEAIYEQQGNRNPFVDNPDWVAEIWGNTSSPMSIIDTEAFNAEFGTVEAGAYLSQLYTLKAYNLEADVTVSVEAPFYLSTDNSSWSSSITLTHETEEEEFEIYIKFEPTEANGETYTATVTHTSTNMETVSLAVSGVEGAQSLITIAQARTKSIGDVVYVSGVVIDAGNNNEDNRIIYDGTAGILVRSFDSGNESANFSLGDSITVKGGLVDYNNLLEIEESPVVIELLKSDATLPDPQEVTISEVGEEHESELVVIKNVSFEEAGEVFGGGGSAGNFTITDGEDELVFRISSADHPLVGTVIPEGNFDIIGFISQYYNDYQLSPRFAADITEVEIPLVTIAEAREKEEGTQVKITGVVIDAGNSSPYNRVIYDGTAGVVVRSEEAGNESSSLVQGDSVVISGKLADYNGLLQISETPIKIELISQDASLPTAQELSIDEIGEDYESELVVIKGVSFENAGTLTAGSYIITDGSNDLILRIGTTSHPLVGTEVSDATYDITGIISEVAEGYQILPRTAADLTESGVTGLFDEKEALFSVYPNPTEGVIAIQSDNISLEKFNYKITSITGKTLVKVKKVSDSKIDISNLKAGVYILTITSDKNSSSIKIIKR